MIFGVDVSLAFFFKSYFSHGQSFHVLLTLQKKQKVLLCGYMMSFYFFISEGVSFTKDSHLNWAAEDSADWIQICAGEVEQG